MLQQLDTPQNLYDKPNNKFVAGFIGSPSMNFVDTTIEHRRQALCQGGRLHPACAGLPRQRRPSLPGQAITLGIRPEHLLEIHQADASIPEDSLIHATVDVVELLGNEIFVYLRPVPEVITARMDPDLHLQRGQQIQVTAPPDRLHFFDPQSEAAIPNHRTRKK